MLNIKSRRRFLHRKSRLVLYLEMKDTIRKVLAKGGISFSRSSSACEYWRRPALNVGENVPRHRKGLLVECEDTNVLCKNAGSSQEDIDLRWNGMEDACLRAFFFNGNCTDEMGNGDGTPSNVSYVQSKEGYGQAAESNGNTTSIVCGSGSDIDDLTTFSVGFAINPDSDGEGNEGRIFDKGALVAYVRDESEGYVSLTVQVQYGTQDAVSTSEKMIPIGKWSDVAITYDENGDRQIHIYLDGGEAAYQTQQASQGSRTSDAANSLYLLNNSAGNRCFEGKIDRFVLWGRELSQEEIKRLAQNGTGALWNFEDNCDDELGIHHGRPINVSFADGEDGRAAGFFQSDSLVNVGKTPFLQNLPRFGVRVKIKVPSKPSISTCYLIHKYLSGNGWAFGLYFDEDGMRLWGIVKAPTDGLSESSTKISYGEWHEIALSYDDYGDRKVHLWADASEVAYDTQQAAVGEVYSDANAELIIGNYTTTTNKCLYGYIERLVFYRRPLVTSELSGGELLCWSRGHRPILGASGGSWDSTTLRDPILLMNEEGKVEKVNGQYVLYYTGGFGYLEYRIGRAVSEDGVHWTKNPSDSAVLSVGSAGSWDEKYVAMGTAIKMNPVPPEAGDQYRLYYSGRDDAGNFGLGLATSSDGINFTKHSGNPLVTGDKWNTDNGALGVAYVVKLSTGQWALMFEGNTACACYLGLSADGISWTAANDGDPVLEGSAGEWDSAGVANPKLFELAPGKYLLGFNGQAGNAQWNIGFAYSTDLTNWTKFSGNPVMVRGPAEWDLARIENAFIATQDVGTDSVRMWYFGGPDSTYFRIGYATCKQTTMDIFDMIDVTGWQKHVEPNLYDGHSVQLCEAGGAAKQFCQTKTLTAQDYIVSFLARTDGSEVTSADVAPFADTALINEISEPHYEHVGDGVYLCWGKFTATAADWNVGVEVKAGKAVYVSLLTSHERGSSTDGGDFPRSLIPNDTGGSKLRASDTCTIPADGNINPSRGTIDAEFTAPCAELEANVRLMVWTIYKDGTHYWGIAISSTGKIQFIYRGGGGEVIASAALTIARNQIIKLRALYDINKIDGTNYLILYANKGGGWIQLAQSAAAIGVAIPAGATIYPGGWSSAAAYHFGGFIHSLRIYDRPLLNPNW